MKAIYTQIGNVIYKMNQTTELPNKVVTPTLNHLSSSLLPEQAALMIDVVVGNVSTAESNKDMYSALEAKLLTDKTKSINVIQNRFKVAIDYTIIDRVTKKELEHAITIQPMDIEDVITPLGVDDGNEVVYRRTKYLKGDVKFHVHRTVPYGISFSKNDNFDIKINDVIIYQDFSETDEVHNSIYSEPYNYTSDTIANSLENMAAVYSSYKEGQEFQTVGTSYTPRKVSIRVKALLGNYVVVHDDANIDDILTTNATPVEPAE